MSKDRDYTWIDWYSLVASALMAAVPDLPEFKPWIISIAPPGFLNPSPDTCTIFAIAKNRIGWKEPAIYQNIRIPSDDFRECAAKGVLNDLIKQHLLIATASLRMNIARLNDLDIKTMEPNGSSAAN